MRMRAVCTLGLLCAAPLVRASIAPDAWVPARWPWNDSKSLELLSDSPVNCLLLKTWTPDLLASTQKRGIITLALIPPADDAAAVAQKAVAASVGGIVLEGDFPDATVAAVRSVA